MCIFCALQVQMKVDSQLWAQVFVIKVLVKAVAKLRCSYNEVLILNFYFLTWQHAPQINMLIASSGEEQCSDKYCFSEQPESCLIVLWR